MKFAIESRGEPQNLGDAITDLVNLQCSQEEKIEVLLRAVAIVAQCQPPWEQTRIGEALGLVRSNG